jgi:hypothetical protein
MSKEYDDLIRFLGLGLLIRDQMEPEMAERWHAEFRRAVEMRGGVTEDGEHIVVDIGRDVMAEVAEVGTRFYAEKLTTGLRERQGMGEAEIERVEVEVSAALRRVLDHIEAAKL